MKSKRYRDQLALEVEPNKRLFSNTAPEISQELRFILSMSLATDIDGCKFQTIPTNEKVFIVNDIGAEPVNVLGSVSKCTAPWKCFAIDARSPAHFIFIYRKKLDNPSTYLSNLKNDLENEASTNTNLSFSILYHE